MRELKASYDVVVSEGGFAGFAAALALRRRGLSVLLVEPRSALGWEATRALQLDWATPNGAIGEEFASVMAETRGLDRGRLDAPLCEMALADMLCRAEVDFLFLARVVGFGVKGDMVRTVRIASKSGETSVRTGALLDASWHGASWSLAGGVIEPAGTAGGLFTIVFNAGQDMPEPVRRLGTLPGARDVTARRGLWPAEVAVEYAVDGSLTDARVTMPQVVRAVREAMPEVKNAIVTHTAQELFPSADALPAAGGRPRFGNVFGAAPWCATPGFRASAAELLDLGERTGEAVAAARPAAAAGNPDIAEPVLLPQDEREADVIVVGGGTAGPFAAIASGRRGAHTVLLEQGSSLGGIMTVGGIHVYYHGVPGGIQDEVDARVADLTHLFCGAYSARGFHPVVKQVVLEQMAAEAGVSVHYGVTVAAVETRPEATTLPARPASRPSSRVKGVRVSSPSGAAVWRAEAVIDSTGDADVAAMAGAAFIFGRESDGLPHAYSLSAEVFDRKSGLGGLNFDAGFCDPTDVADMTRARCVGLGHYRRRPFDADTRLLAVAPLLGLRNARQVIGDYQLTLADEIEGREFPDVIAYAYSHYDNHARDFENESDAAVFWVWALGQWRRHIGCEVPYRCLLPRGVEGLLVACRGISVTFDAHHQLRMQRDMQRIGEAAGIAAALAVRGGCTPRQVNMRALQAELAASGALGKPELRKLPAPAEAALVLHESAWKPAPPPARPVVELVQRLGTEDNADAVWRLVRTGPVAAPELLKVLRGEDPEKRYWAAVALAGMDRAEAGEELIRCLDARIEKPLDPRIGAPRWLAAVALLGRLRERRAVPAIAAVLHDASASLDARIAAVRALGRIGDASVAPQIESMLERTDLPAVRVLSSASGRPVVEEDCRWQLDLATAQALAGLGRPRPDLARRHLDDPRLLVRRQASRVLETLSGPRPAAATGGGP